MRRRLFPCPAENRVGALPYRWIDHIGEVELRIDAATEAEVFAEALRALSELVGGNRSSKNESFTVTVSASDRATMLARWLDELAYRAEMDGLLPEELERLELTDDHLVATVRGRHGEAPHLVKGVTYHRLAFDRADGACRATVVIDV
jgi:SHS2 domain-containing protein